MVTGLGLFFIGGVRAPLDWLVFVGATLAAAVLLPRLFESPKRDRRAVTAEGGYAPSQSNRPRGKREEIQPSRERDLAPGPDPVDYLRALRHEFRTPLNAVLGFSDVLLSGIDGEVNASQREDLEIIRASGIRLRVLLDSAFDFSQLEEGELRVEMEAGDVREVVTRACSEARQLWSGKRKVHCELPDGPCTAEVDEVRLRRSLLVLADFLAVSHRDAEVTVKLAPSADHLAIEVIAEGADRLVIDQLPTTEDILAAEDMTKLRQWPIAVASELITRHGGSLYLGAAPSRFLVRLPFGGTP